MKQNLIRLAIVLLLVVIVGLPLVIRPSGEESGYTNQADETLVVITPHNEQIRYEIERAFNAHRLAQEKPTVAFDWRTSGGTSDLRKTVLSQFAQLARHGREDEGIGVDLFFGGGEYEHYKLKQGVSSPDAATDGPKRISVSVPIDIDQTALEEIYPQTSIGGERLYDPDRHWLGVALASFGIVYNNDVLGMLDLPKPQTWDDLTAPAYRDWIALADPGHSGSISATYNTILRRLGWTDGWSVLRRVFANARYFASGASKVPVDVSSGDAAAGMCIDFYGRYQAGVIGRDRVGYISPARSLGNRQVSMTATTADPISLLRGAPNPQLAQEFILWALSKPAQRLWQRSVGEPDGPAKFQLRRLPIRRDLYTDEEKQYWIDAQVEPFETALPVPDAMPDFYGAVAVVSHAMAIDIQEDLVAAWNALQRTPDSHPNKMKMLELFDAMPPELTLTWPNDDLATNWRSIILNPDDSRYETVAKTLSDFYAGVSSRGMDHREQLERKLRWTKFFRDNYQQIVSLAP